MNFTTTFRRVPPSDVLVPVGTMQYEVAIYDGDKPTGFRARGDSEQAAKAALYRSLRGQQACLVRRLGAITDAIIFCDGQLGVPIDEAEGGEQSGE